VANELKKAYQDNAWCCYVSAKSDVVLPKIDELFLLIDSFPKTLKDDRRSLVKLGKLSEFIVVAKQPKDKNRRKWIQFLSLFGAAEARKTFLTLLEFQLKGIESLQPLCLLEKRKLGMVVDSWLLYEYREGSVSNESHIPQIIDQLKLLHKHGYQHEDPNFGNFMLDESGNMFLIDCKGKARSGYFSDCYDFMLLNRVGLSDVQIHELVDMNTHSIGYWLARLYQGYIRTRTALKVKIKGKTSKGK